MSSKKNAAATELQKKMLIQLIRTNHQLVSGKFSSEFTTRHARKIWENISEQLNSVPGAHKNWKRWRKTWQDMRSRTKMKNLQMTKYRQWTADAGVPKQELSSTEDAILDLINPTLIDDNQARNEVYYIKRSPCASAGTPEGELQDFYDDVPNPEPMEETRFEHPYTARKIIDGYDADVDVNKAHYYKEKLRLYERDVIAKESIASSLRALLELKRENIF